MKPSKSPSRVNDLINTISYFSFFAFAPSFQDIFTFFPRKISQNELKDLLKRQIAAHRLVSRPAPGTVVAYNLQNSLKNLPLYTLPQYGMHIKNRASRGEITRSKLRGMVPYLNVLFALPFIRFIGISGSAAMENCKKTADIDLLVVTAPNRLFTGRFLSILLAMVFGIRNPRGVCLNIFLDERNLSVPPADRSLYTAHEVIQLKPFRDKGNVHARFLAANRWAQEFFPNAVFPRMKQTVKTPSFPGLHPVERVLKHIQLSIIRKNRTGHHISATQLWLFKRDFGKKLVSLFPGSYLL